MNVPICVDDARLIVCTSVLEFQVHTILLYTYMCQCNVNEKKMLIIMMIMMEMMMQHIVYLGIVCLFALQDEEESSTIGGVFRMLCFCGMLFDICA